jgi:hypothetical protein
MLLTVRQAHRHTKVHPLSDPCVIILLRRRKTLVARFTRLADPRGIRRTAEEVRSNAESEPDG